MRLAVGALYKRKIASVTKIPRLSRTLTSIVPAGRIRRPWYVLQYLRRYVWHLRNVPRWRKSRRLRAAIPCLDRRARHRAVRAKHATVARLRLKPLVAPFAVIEKLASVGRHRFDRPMPTLGTGDGRIQLHHRTFLDRPGRREAAGRGHSQTARFQVPISNSNFTSIINLSASLSKTRVAVEMREERMAPVLGK